MLWTADQSRVVLYAGFGIFGMWLVSPFVTRRKSFHTVVVLKRVLVILITCQVLRIISFLATQVSASVAAYVQAWRDSML